MGCRMASNLPPFHYPLDCPCYPSLLDLIYVSSVNQNRTMKMQRPLRRQWYTFGARINIMWEEQFVDPPIHYKSVINYLPRCSYHLLYSVSAALQLHYYKLPQTWLIFSNKICKFIILYKCQPISDKFFSTSPSKNVNFKN